MNIIFNWKTTKTLPTTIGSVSSDVFFIVNYQLHKGHYHSNNHFYNYGKTTDKSVFNCKDVDFWCYADEVEVNK